MEIKSVCVVGAGTVGSQLAFQAALGGLSIRLTSRRQETLDKGIANATRLLRRRVEKGTLTEFECEDAIARVSHTTKLEEALPGADLMVEAVAERLDVKEEVFRRAGELADEPTILATTSSTIGIHKLAPLTGRPDRCINAHFFNPVLLMDLVEVVRGPGTSDATVEAVMAFARRVGRHPVLVRRESYGFIVNRVIFTAIREALRLVDEGAATPEDVDEACVRGLNWPMGPIKLADFIGLDVIRDAWLLGKEEMADASWEPTDELTRRVEAGELGMKSGQGFLAHDKG
ncbi:MAG: 3-hydroxyacyl-CoA dehydrogenase family protein [Candidatus Dormibacteria bacterium]